MGETDPLKDPMVIAAAAVIVIGALTTAIVTLMSAFGKMKSELLTQMAKVNVKTQEIADATTVTAAASVITSKKVDHLTVQTGELKVATGEIHTLTNSNHDALKKELAAAHLEIKGLHEQAVASAKSQATMHELVTAVLGREKANGDEIHTIAESLKEKERPT